MNKINANSNEKNQYLLKEESTQNVNPVGQETKRFHGGSYKAGRGYVTDKG